MGSDTLCRVCGADNLEVIFRSPSASSVTSIGTQLDAALVVRLCVVCGHCQSDIAEDVVKFMGDAYHDVVRGSMEPFVHRPAQQPVLLSDLIVGYIDDSLSLSNFRRVLEWGANAANFVRALHVKHPNLDCRAFAKTNHYSAVWNDFLPNEQQAVGALPRVWLGQFDLVVSNFDLAHSYQPLVDCIEMRQALRSDGMISISVPDPFRNTGDILVVNHANHFTCQSLATLLRNAGFGAINVRKDLHPSRLVAFATNRSDGSDAAESPNDDLANFAQLGRRWSEAIHRIREFESVLAPSDRIAIYGAGFYGAFALSILRHPERVILYLDGDTRRHGASYLDRPIRVPSEANGSFEALIVGLDPRVAVNVFQSSGLVGLTDSKLFFF